ncbi:13218_t:CDS:10 [Acaulospora colombiana]|uniref:13218_t:CDS:1 n=1 Tax=Acaulospora colombiana TaxID=27376 RepID=A0ACA9JVU3_9GLOM|nr:13218_t:CDS:10 [Acaulospora colombiana]
MDSAFRHHSPSEDCVSYSLYFPLLTQNPSDSGVKIENFDQSKESFQDSNDDFLEFLRETSALILSELKRFLDGYVWHKEPVSDNDGEFLLIEAAMRLPSWLDPSNSENRIFIYRNELHIIPLSESSNDESQIPEGTLTLERAIQLVRNDNVNTRADDKIQTAVFAKIREYPDKIKQNLHHARCHIPRKIAHLLYHDPQLVSSAVEAFYTRDPIALKVCIVTCMPEDGEISAIHINNGYCEVYENLVCADVSRLLFKLACGFEILCTDKYFTELPSELDDIDIEKYPFNSDSSWRIFHANLLSRDYYRGELPGSKLYKQLDEIAKRQFLQNNSHECRSTSSLVDDEIRGWTSPVKRINEILSRPLISDEVLIANTNEDDDSWLNVDHKQLEDLLEASNKDATEYEEIKRDNSDDELNVFDLTNMIDKLESFINDDAGLEGAEFFDEHDLDEDEDEDFEFDADNSQVQFEPAEFLRIMRQTLGMTDEEYRELANTKIKMQQGESEQIDASEFMDQSQYINTETPPQHAKIVELTDDDDMEAYLQALDAELSSSKVYESFIRSPDQVIEDIETNDDIELNEKKEENDGNDSDEELNKPVNIDLNLAKNVLESFKSQEGLPGPAGNILGRIGVGVIPVDSDDEDDYVESPDEDA